MLATQPGALVLPLGRFLLPPAMWQYSIAVSANLSGAFAAQLWACDTRSNPLKRSSRVSAPCVPALEHWAVSASSPCSSPGPYPVVLLAVRAVSAAVSIRDCLLLAAGALVCERGANTPDCPTPKGVPCGNLKVSVVPMRPSSPCPNSSNSGFEPRLGNSLGVDCSRLCEAANCLEPAERPLGPRPSANLGTLNADVKIGERASSSSKGNFLLALTARPPGVVCPCTLIK